MFFNVSSTSFLFIFSPLNKSYKLIFKTSVSGIKTAISGFKEILKKAKGKNQDVDVINEKPDYDILIRYENGDTQGLHLLLGNAGDESVITYIGHEKYGYIVSPEDINKLKNILKKMIWKFM